MPEFIKEVLPLRNADIDRGRFPWTLPVLREFERLKLHPSLTFFVGENGSGKSTLLEGIATAFGFPAEGGRRQHSYSTYDSHTILGEELTLVKGERPSDNFFLRAESFYNLATYTKRAAEGLPPSLLSGVHELSHGQGFHRAMQGFRPPGLYLFDEPESALSPSGQFILLARMKDFIDQGS